MARIKIEDLPLLNDLSSEEGKRIFGGAAALGSTTPPSNIGLPGLGTTGAPAPGTIGLPGMGTTGYVAPTHP